MSQSQLLCFEVSALFVDAAASAGGHSEDQTAQRQRSQKVPPEKAVQAYDEPNDREADEGAAETKSALDGAREAQQQAMQAGQEALAEEQRDLVQLNQDLQQQPGQPQHVVRRQSLYCYRHSLDGCMGVCITYLSVLEDDKRYAPTSQKHAVENKGRQTKQALSRLSHDTAKDL